MNILVSGGCKNGKSYRAQKLAAEMAAESGKPLYYIATMIPKDQEDHRRIQNHLKERDGWGFATLEQPKSVSDLLSRENVDPSGIFLLDSVTAVLENEMFSFEDGVFHLDAKASDRVKQDLVGFAEATGNTIFVVDGIFGDMYQYSPETELYRKGLAEISIALAKVCDRVIEISYGTEEIWK